MSSEHPSEHPHLSHSTLVTELVVPHQFSTPLNQKPLIVLASHQPNLLPLHCAPTFTQFWKDYWVCPHQNPNPSSQTQWKPQKWTSKCGNTDNSNGPCTCHLLQRKPTTFNHQKTWLHYCHWKKIRAQTMVRGIGIISRRDLNNYSSITIWCPYPLAALAKEEHTATREMMQAHTLEAQRKWRTPYTNIPWIYLSEKDWARVIPIERTVEFLQEIIQVTSLEVIKGIDNMGVIKTKYFIDESEHRKLMRKLKRRRRDFLIEPIFPLPRWGISQKPIKEGMTWLESQQATALYHIELEAVLKEIFAHSFDNISSRVFTREWHCDKSHFFLYFWDIISIQ